MEMSTTPEVKYAYNEPYSSYIKNLDNSQTSYQYYHYIFYDWHLDIRAGGPTGYLANLLSGLNLLEEQEYNSPILINFAVRPKQSESISSGGHQLYLKALSVLRKNHLFNYLYVNHFSRSFNMRHENNLRFLQECMNMEPTTFAFPKIDLAKTKTIHVHEVVEAIRVKNALIKNGLDNDIKIILTCHVPESVARERYNNYLDEGYSKEKASEIAKGWSKIEQAAYLAADILIYPSEEAMMPAQHFVPNFNELIEGKDIRFVATGAKEISLKSTKEEAKKKYGVTGKFVVAYMGRHNAIKGYDILKAAAEKLLKKYSDIVFLIGGTQGNEFKPLKNARWIECGRVNPAEFLSAADVFVLPNRETYYDLVLIETMSAGIPIIASHTGGNISVQKKAPMLFTYQDGIDGLCSAVEEFHKKSSAELKNIGDSLRKCYYSYFTIEKFAERYRQTITEIYQDYGFI